MLNSQVAELPHGYRKIKLGMTFQTVQKELLADKIFGYRGERDVSLLPSNYKQKIIESSGYSFIERSWFLFNEDRLYTFTINLNKEMIDYHSVFSTLCKKYGEPNFLNPEKCVWKNDWISMSLEKPLTIKYVDTVIFERLKNESAVQESALEMLKDDFLDSL